MSLFFRNLSLSFQHLIKQILFPWPPFILNCACFSLCFYSLRNSLDFSLLYLIYPQNAVIKLLIIPINFFELDKTLSENRFNKDRQ